MSYNFEIIGVAPILTFFDYQQTLEIDRQRSKTYIGSYYCTLDSFIESTEMIPAKPQWNWEEVMQTMVNFWLKHEGDIRHWQQELKQAEANSILVARVANFDSLRSEFEEIFDV